jgi:two-component system, OmpR family, sensor histidine kinase KdpD
VSRPLLSLARSAVSTGVVLVVTAVYHLGVPVNPTTVALTYVAVVLLVASRWGVVEATTASVVATACLNVFFLPPVGTLTIADPQNWVALAVFLVTGIVASQLSGRARRRTVDAESRRRELEQLYALSRALLLSPGRPTMAGAIARHVADAFEFPSVAVFDHRADNLSWAGATDVSALESKLREVARQGVSLHEGSMLFVAIRLGGAPIGALAIPNGGLSDTVVQSIASLAAIGLERARGLEAAARAEAAQESGQLRATMLDALAHEFKTPLTSMKVAAADLRANAPDERNREMAVIIDEDLDRLQSLVTDSVAMVRVDAGDFTLRPDRHRVADLVAWTLRQFEARLDDHDVLVSVPDTLLVQADRELLGLALRQLLDNAVKYSPPSSPIEIAATGGATVEIAVRNSGTAIPEREQTRLFERFYRGAQARQLPGTGMGLAIVRQIAEAHRGSVRVQSAPGAGTEFVISLPQEEGVR